MCIALLPLELSYDRRRRLPSMAMISPLQTSATSLVQETKLASNCSGEIRERTRLKVSELGMPFSSDKKPFSQFYLRSQIKTISSQSLAPQRLPMIVMTMISIRRCFFVRSIRGSSTEEKCSINERGPSIAINSKLKYILGENFNSDLSVCNQ